jgi:hypothetical protein
MVEEQADIAVFGEQIEKVETLAEQCESTAAVEDIETEIIDTVVEAQAVKEPVVEAQAENMQESHKEENEPAQENTTMMAGEEQQLPLTPRRSSRIQQKSSSNLSTPSKLSTQVTATSASSSMRRSVRRVSTAAHQTMTEAEEGGKRKSARTPKVQEATSEKKRGRAMSTGAGRKRQSSEDVVGEEQNAEDKEYYKDNSPSIQATRKTSRRQSSSLAAGMVEIEDKENMNSSNKAESVSVRIGKRANVEATLSEPDITVRKSARTRSK